jgi:putative aminopeptidase FrvX
VKETLRRLVAAYGPPGHETAVAGEIATLLRPHVDDLYTDPLGNVIATLRAAGTPAVAAPVERSDPGHPSSPRVMLCAHMDQAGLICTDVTPEGLLRFSVVGRLAATSLPGQRVQSRRGIPGIVSLDTGVEVRDIAPGKMHVDIGAADRAAAKDAAGPGDIFLPVGGLLDLGDYQSSPALDNRAGCAVLIEVARRLRSIQRDTVTVHFVFTVQGAIAPRGALAAAYKLRPDLGLVVDVTRAKDPGAKFAPELGQGPAIRLRGDSYLIPPAIRDRLEEAAGRAGLRHQLDLSLAEETATDAAAIEIAGAGALTGVLALPARACWTTSATVSLTDLDTAAALLIEVVRGPATKR